LGERKKRRVREVNGYDTNEMFKIFAGKRKEKRYTTQMESEEREGVNRN